MSNRAPNKTISTNGTKKKNGQKHPSHISDKSNSSDDEKPQPMSRAPNYNLSDDEHEYEDEYEQHEMETQEHDQTSTTGDGTHHQRAPNALPRKQQQHNVLHSQERCGKLLNILAMKREDGVRREEDEEMRSLTQAAERGQVQDSMTQRLNGDNTLGISRDVWENKLTPEARAAWNGNDYYVRGKEIIQRRIRYIIDPLEVKFVVPPRSISGFAWSSDRASFVTTFYILWPYFDQDGHVKPPNNGAPVTEDVDRVWINTLHRDGHEGVLVKRVPHPDHSDTLAYCARIHWNTIPPRWRANVPNPAITPVPATPSADILNGTVHYQEEDDDKEEEELEGVVNKTNRPLPSIEKELGMGSQDRNEKKKKKKTMTVQKPSTSSTAPKSSSSQQQKQKQVQKQKKMKNIKQTALDQFTKAQPSPALISKTAPSLETASVTAGTNNDDVADLKEAQTKRKELFKKRDRIQQKLKKHEGDEDQIAKYQTLANEVTAKLDENRRRVNRLRTRIRKHCKQQQEHTEEKEQQRQKEEEEEQKQKKEKKTTGKKRKRTSNTNDDENPVPKRSKANNGSIGSNNNDTTNTANGGAITSPTATTTTKAAVEAENTAALNERRKKISRITKMLYAIVLGISEPKNKQFKDVMANELFDGLAASAAGSTSILDGVLLALLDKIDDLFINKDRCKSKNPALFVAALRHICLAHHIWGTETPNLSDFKAGRSISFITGRILKTAKDVSSLNTTTEGNTTQTYHYDAKHSKFVTMLQSLLRPKTFAAALHANDSSSADTISTNLQAMFTTGLLILRSFVTPSTETSSS